MEWQTAPGAALKAIETMRVEQQRFQQFRLVEEH
jgi:hypothetical protein